MSYQGQIDFTARTENNLESNQILQANKDHINSQCGKVLQLLRSGHKLTVRSAMVDYGISSLPRRILDLKEKLGIEIKTRLVDGRYKEYFIENQNNGSN